MLIERDTTVKKECPGSTCGCFVCAGVFGQEKRMYLKFSSRKWKYRQIVLLMPEGCELSFLRVLIGRLNSSETPCQAEENDQSDLHLAG